MNAFHLVKLLAKYKHNKYKEDPAMGWGEVTGEMKPHCSAAVVAVAYVSP